MENNVSLDETSRDLSLLTSIEQNPDVSQATLADELGVAVGTINWYLKRLIAKGYVKVKRAQRKKLRYIITPEGIALRAALTVDYIKNSFNLYRLVRERTNLCLQQLQDAGYESVNVLGGEDEVAEVVRLTCLEQGVELTNDAQAPQIRIEGIKLALKLPEAAQTNADPAEDTNRGDHG